MGGLLLCNWIISLSGSWVSLITHRKMDIKLDKRSDEDLSFIGFCGIWENRVIECGPE